MKKILDEKIDSLPPLPQSILELEDFRNLDNPSTEELIKIIEKDPLMITTILRIANSSMYGFRSQVETLSRAINLLGINFTISIAIGSVVQNTLKSNLNAYDISNDKFIYICALASEIINIWVSQIDEKLKVKLLMPAFLQEIGKFIISDFIQQNKLEDKFKLELNTEKSISACEKEFTGLTSSKITANIFKYWSFSPNIILPIAYIDKMDDCPTAFVKSAQILEITKILTDIRNPFNEKAIENATKKAIEYNFDTKILLTSIKQIKSKLK